MTIKVGDRVQVVESLIVYHHPDRRGQAFDLKGLQGEVTNILHDWHGKPISPNLPIVVKFDKKFIAHFRDSEVEVVS